MKTWVSNPNGVNLHFSLSEYANAKKFVSNPNGVNLHFLMFLILVLLICRFQTPTG